MAILRIPRSSLYDLITRGEIAVIRYGRRRQKFGLSFVREMSRLPSQSQSNCGGPRPMGRMLELTAASGSEAGILAQARARTYLQ